MIVPVRRSCTWKKESKKTTSILVVAHSAETDIKFIFIEGTCRTLVKCRGKVEVGKDREPVWVMGKLEPSPITTLSAAVYGE